MRMATITWLASSLIILLFSGCASVHQEASPAVPSATAGHAITERVGILSFSGPFGEQVADRLGESLEDCGMEVIPRLRLEPQGDYPSGPAGVRVSQDRFAAWAEQFNVRLFLEGDIVLEDGQQDKYARLMMDVRLVDGTSGQVEWSRRAQFWSSANSNRSGDLNRAATQMSAIICNELGSP